MDWFSSDFHFNHKNICRGTSEWNDGDSVRDFDTLEEMNDTIINNLNEVIRPSDTLYFLGDFAFGDKRQIPSLRSRIKCQNIYGISGNHDKAIWESYQGIFKWFRNYAEITTTTKAGKKKVTLIHYAMRVWNKSHHGSWHLYGHSHGSLPDDPNSLSMDVGVDTNNFRPYSANDILEIMEKKQWKSVDHHTEKTKQ